MALVMLFYYKEKVTFGRSGIVLCLVFREKGSESVVKSTEMVENTTIL